MEKWKQILSKKITDPRKLKKLFRVDEREIKKVVRKYPMSINPYYLSQIKKKGDSFWKQCIPDIREVDDRRGEDDPLKEDKHTPIFGLVHRYPDRVLLLVSNMCAMNCRFCTRKRKVGKKYHSLQDRDLDRAIRYIRSKKKIRDVILSGGDPLLLDDAKIEKYLKRIRKIDHVEIIRIDSRTPCSLPQRITPKFCNMLKKYAPIYFLTHFNHPDAVTKEAKKACEMLADAGVVMGNQSVMLKGINDDPKVLMKLGQELLKAKVRPYYIYIPDAVKGTYHFRVQIKKAIKIMKGVVGHTSGLAVPHLIIDLENGGGKIPLCPRYYKRKRDHTYVFTNFENKQFIYHDV